MKEVIIDTVENLQKILDALAKGKHSQIAAMSNLGTPKGAVRITILPNSAFKKIPSYSKRDAKEWLKSFKELLG